MNNKMDFSSITIIEHSIPVTENDKEIIEDRLYNIFSKYINSHMIAIP